MPENLDSPLVLTKLRVPVVRPRHISRAHLLDRLTPETGAGLVLVCAPAGYGKTTLLAEWAHSLRQDGAAVAWYALDSGDDTPVPFGAYLVASLAQALGPMSELEKAAQLLRSSPEIELHKVLPGVINAAAASDRVCWLILDDYHLIGAPAIHTAIAFLIEHRPENLHIVLGSRSDPPLPLARLRARGQLLEMRAPDLRFTPEETRRFLNEVMQLDLPAEMAAALEERTEGWAAGLQLAALSLSGRPDKENFLGSFIGSHRYLVEYLLEEVLHQQPREVQEFLLCTSVLERLCASLCAAILESRERKVENRDPRSENRPNPPKDGSRFSVLGSRLATQDAQSILDYLDRSNLFLIPLDDEGRWYRYHHLFRDFLQTQLRKTLPEKEMGLHRAASEWFAAPSGAHGSLREAARHAFQTRDWDYAAAFVEQHGFTMLLHSEISTIYEWCSAFPEDVMQAHPMLCIHQCWPWVMRFRRENRVRIEARLQQAERAVAAMEDPQLAGRHLAGQHLAANVAEAAAVIRTFMAMAPDPVADPRQQLAHTRSLLGSYPEGDAGQFSGLLTAGYCHLALHEAEAASQALQAARQAALNGRLFFGIAESTFNLARLAHTQGQLRRAAEICREGQATIAAMLAHPEQELPGIGCLDIALGCLLLEQDQLEEAEDRLLHGLDLVGWRMNPYYPMTACTALSRLREIQGRSTEAAEFLSRLEEAWPDIAFCTQGLRILQALRIRSQDPGTRTAAAAWCADFSATLGDGAFLPGMGPYGAAEVYYRTSLAWARLQIEIGQPQAALAYLERQLTLAQAHGLATRVIELSLLEAQAAQADAAAGAAANGGDDSRTWAALERALAAAQTDAAPPPGFIRIFDQGPALARLLVEAAQRGIYRDFTGRVLAAITTPRAVPFEDEGKAVPPGAATRSAPLTYLEAGEQLSEREQEVLRLMAQGATNQAIAQQLVITVGTVKSHINHILGKLDSHNRTEAVARARAMGLLEI